MTKVLTIRLDEELHETLDKKAEELKLTKSDLVKNLILRGLEYETEKEFVVLLNKLESMEKTLKDLSYKAAISSTANRFYGKQMTNFVIDIGRYLQKDRPLTKEEKLDAVAERDSKAQKYAEEFVSK